jgi:hypothetical protein
LPEISLPDVGHLDTLGVLFALLPGLVTVLIVRALTARSRKLDTVETVLQGLAYTLLVHATWVILKMIGSWIPTPDLAGLSLCSVALGVLVSWATNSDLVYGLLRKVRLTAEPSWNSIWESAFREFRNTTGEYIVLEFKDGRRLKGGVRGFSSDQENGYVYLARCRWIDPTSEQLEQPGTLLFNAHDIKFVQFLPNKKGKR